MAESTNIFLEAASLPVEERIALADSLLRSLNSPSAEIDLEWAGEAQKRLREIRDQKVAPVDGALVIERISRLLPK